MILPRTPQNILQREKSRWSQICSICEFISLATHFTNFTIVTYYSSLKTPFYRDFKKQLEVRPSDTCKPVFLILFFLMFALKTSVVI